MWPWTRSKRKIREHHHVSPDAEASAEQALRARIDATAQRLKSDELARRFDRAKERNHFGEAVTRAMKHKDDPA